ncbi:hypothetical protein GCM10027019_23230 [Melaminivora jejuensis]
MFECRAHRQPASIPTFPQRGKEEDASTKGRGRDASQARAAIKIDKSSLHAQAHPHAPGGRAGRRRAHSMKASVSPG